MKIFAFLPLTLLLLSCSASKTTTLIGTWKLTEQRVDIGDGSSTFKNIESDKTISFYKNGTVKSNGDICTMTAQPDSNTIGSYDIAEKTLTSESCVETVLKIRYELIDNTLVLSYPCFEPCQQKFVKL